MDNLINLLKTEITNFCTAINEAEKSIRVLTPEEIEDDRLDLEEVILQTEPNINRAEVKLIEIINKAINGQATLDDIVDASMRVLKNKEREE